MREETLLLGQDENLVGVITLPAAAQTGSARPAFVLLNSGLVHRVGRGKGFYDRLLKDTTAVKLAPCLDMQVFDRVPMDDTDVPVDMLVTETRTIDCSA